MLVCYMNKFFLYIIFMMFFEISAFAKEPTLCILRSVHTNEYQRFSKGMYEFVCRPYGVITVDELYIKAKVGSDCKKSIEEFYKESPLLKYFTTNLLKLKQQYHVKFRDKRCIVYANGREVLSEVLIKKGLAVKKPMLKDEEFEHSFSNAQIYAKSLKRGLFKNKITRKCISELYKK